MDELLGCDEDLGQKLSASSRRRRKYAVGRRDVIKEEDESSDNSILSESWSFFRLFCEIANNNVFTIL